MPFTGRAACTGTCVCQITEITLEQFPVFCLYIQGKPGCSAVPRGFGNIETTLIENGHLAQGLFVLPHNLLRTKAHLRKRLVASNAP